MEIIISKFDALSLVYYSRLADEKLLYHQVNVFTKRYSLLHCQSYHATIRKCYVETVLGHVS